MTPEQRELLDGWASKTKWATMETLEVAIRAALAENDALRKDRERLNKMEAAAIASSPARPDNRWIFVEGQCDYATWGDVPARTRPSVRPSTESR